MAIFVSGLAPSSAIGQEQTATDDLWAGVEEMVVVSAGTAAILQEATVSAVSFDAEILQAEGIQNISDLSSFTPNLEIKTAFAATNPTLFIRGVGLDDFNANSASAVAVYQDDIYMNSPAGQLFQLFDVKGLNVLRGPQGVFYRNASAGVIQVIAEKPKDEFGAFLTTTYGRFNQVEIEGALNIPIAEDYVLWRGSFKTSRRDGITENRCNDLQKQPTPALRTPCQQAVGRSLGDHVNDRDNWAARSLTSIVLPMPADQEVDLLWNLHGGQNLSGAAQFQHTGLQFRRPAPGEVPIAIPGRDASGYQDTDGDPFAGDYNFEGKEKLWVWGTSITATWDPVDWLNVKAVSGYEFHDRDTRDNTDASPRDFLQTDYKDEAWQLSHELRLTANWNDSLETAIGGLYFREDLRVNNVFNQFITQISFSQDYRQEIRAFSVYADVRWEKPDFDGWVSFFDQITLEGGIRYSEEDKFFEIQSLALATGGAVAPSIPLTGSHGSFEGFSGRAVLSYEIVEDKSIYFQYSRGWKPGHFNGGSLFSTEIIEPVKPETVDSYEIGLRTLWFDERMLINLTGFAYQYKNLQVFQLEQDSRGFALPKLINAEEASIYGVEMEFHVSPIERLDINFAGGWLLSEYEKFGISLEETRRVPGGDPPFTIINVDVDYSGNRLVASPVWSFTGSIQYEIELGSEFGMLRPRFSYAWKDDVFFDVNEGAGARGNLPDGRIGQDAYWQLNAGLTYVSPDGGMELTGWVRNFLDEQYKVQSFDISSTFRFLLDAYGDPRTYGLTFKANF